MKFTTIYCSNTCKNKYTSLHKDGRLPKRHCDICGIEFIPKRRDSITCSDTCRWKRQNDRKPRISNKSYWKSSKMKKTSLSPIEKEITRGLLLGDGGLVIQTDGFYKVSVTHKATHKEYLTWKAENLPTLFMNTTPSCQIIPAHPHSLIPTKEHEQCSLHSISHPFLNETRHFFYRGKRPFVSPKLLHLLTPTSLLIWYLDDGSLSKKARVAKLCTSAYDISVVRGIKKWFWHTHQISTHISMVKKLYRGKDKCYPILSFHVGSTQQFFNILRSSPLFPHVPNCMRYKLGE